MVFSFDFQRIESGDIYTYDAKGVRSTQRFPEDLDYKFAGFIKMSSKHLFDGFNPDNTLLKQVNFMRNTYQNSKIFVDEKGKEIKWKISFQDQMEFVKLKPG